MTQSKIHSIRDKLIALIAKTLVSTILVFTVTLMGMAFFTINTFIKFEEQQNRKNLIAKGELLVLNSSAALRELVPDNAFFAIRNMIASSVSKDQDVIYGIFMDGNRQAWANANAENPEGIVNGVLILSDSMSIWADTVTQPSFRYFDHKGQSTYEFVVPIHFEKNKLGTIRFGISTQTFEENITKIKEQMELALFVVFACAIFLGLIVYLIASAAAKQQAKSLTNPLDALTQAADIISSGDYKTPVTTSTNDEIGLLAQSFESMRKTIQEYTNNLEKMVEKRTSQLKAAQRQLVDKAHKAGMAEIATNTLHNIGNILNSVKTSAHIIENVLKNSSTQGFKKANQLLNQNMADLATFITENPKGPKLMTYYLKLEEALDEEQDNLNTHLIRLSEKLDVITEVISTQQSYAGQSQLSELYNLSDVIDDALTMQAGSTERYQIQIIKDLQDVPEVFIQKTKLIHVLINLLSNAKDAMLETPSENRKLYISLFQEHQNVLIKIRDTGQGMSPEHLKKIFVHGYTTKKTGHGFGLHSSANYLTEMNGDLLAESEGPGKGATFVLRFSIPQEQAPPEVQPAK